MNITTSLACLACANCGQPMPGENLNTCFQEKIYSFCREDCQKSWNSEHKVTLLESRPAFDASYRDTSVSPADDFYTYAVGRWIKTQTIPAGYSSWGTFQQIGKKVEDQLEAIFLEITGKESHEAHLAKVLYEGAKRQFLEDVAGFDAIEPLLEMIDGIDSTHRLVEVIAKLHLEGFHPFFSWSVDPHPTKNSQYILHLYEGGILLADHEIYLQERFKDILEKYHHYLWGIDVQQADQVIALEKKLASQFWTKEERRNKDLTNHIFSQSDFTEKFSCQIWQTLFSSWNIFPDSINVKNPKFFKALASFIENTSLEELKAYLKVHVFSKMAPCLGSRYYNHHFNFFGKSVHGIKSPLPINQRCTSKTSELIDEAVGKLYVQKHFTADKKEKALAMVQLIKGAVVEKIQSLSWMGEETKQKAIDKVEKMVVLIGYPDQGFWTDYTPLKTISSERSFAANVLDVQRFNVQEEFNRLGTFVDKRRFPMPPQLVNACNSTNQNKICFPAGILHHPFFTSDDAVTLGAFGMVIAHEIIHSFDDQGRKIDADGNLKEWWTEEDKQAYQAHAQLIEDQFSQYSLTFGDEKIFVRGGMTLGENIADLGGMIVAYQALQKLDLPVENGWTKEQRFFFGYAQVWTSLFEEERAKHLLNNDPHSPALWRVNGVLAQMPEFKHAFDLPDECRMVISEEKRSKMWR